MIKKAIILSWACFILCEAPASIAQETVITHRGAHGAPCVITVEAGPAWIHTFRVGGLIPIKTPPQIAIWAENPDGEYLATLFVSRRSATQNWKGGGQSARRPEALPCWSHRRNIRYPDGLFMPTADDPLPDAVTAATPGGSFTLNTVLPGGSERVILFAEFNQSFDYNRHFPKKTKPEEPGYSGVSGQPSVIFSGVYRTGMGKTSVELRLTGFGSPGGADGTVTNDLSRLTTSKEIVLRITAE